MGGMQIRIKHGEKMIVNGAEIEFLSDANFRFTNTVRFVYGRQVMSPDEATSPARRIYLAMQTAYMSEPRDRPPAMTDAQGRINSFRLTTTAPAARQLLDRIWNAAEEDKFDQSLRAAMRLVHHEEDMIRTMPSSESADTDLS